MKINKRVLVVDDNEDYCDGVVGFLQTKGCRAVVIVADGDNEFCSDQPDTLTEKNTYYLQECMREAMGNRGK